MVVPFLNLGSVGHFSPAQALEPHLLGDSTDRLAGREVRIGQGLQMLHALLFQRPALLRMALVHLHQPLELRFGIVLTRLALQIGVPILPVEFGRPPMNGALTRRAFESESGGVGRDHALQRFQAAMAPWSTYASKASRWRVFSRICCLPLLGGRRSDGERLRSLAGVGFPARHNHVDEVRIDFQQEGAPAGLFRRRLLLLGEREDNPFDLPDILAAGFLVRLNPTRLGGVDATRLASLVVDAAVFDRAGARELIRLAAEAGTTVSQLSQLSIRTLIGSLLELAEACGSDAG